MKPRTLIIVIFIILTMEIVLSLILRTPSSKSSRQQVNTNTPPTQISFETQVNEGGNVTVSVFPLSLKPGRPASFDVVFETHSVDLTFDVIKVATLIDDTKTTYTPRWDGSPPGGHHRKGTLRFTPDLSNATTYTLTLRDIAGIPTRIFNWKVKQ